MCMCVYMWVCVCIYCTGTTHFPPHYSSSLTQLRLHVAQIVQNNKWKKEGHTNP